MEQRLPKGQTWKTFVRENHFQVSQEDNGAFVTLRMHAWNPKLSTRLGGKIWAYLTLRLIGIYIRRCGRPDVIHAHFATWAGYAARLACHKYGIPYVVTEHASSINAGNVTHEQAATLRTAYSDAMRVVCVGSLLKKNLTPYLRSPEQAVVIPNFVDIGTFRFSTRDPETPRPFTFVSVGNLNKRKGFGELIEAFSRTFKSRREVRLAIVGDGEEENSLKEQIRHRKDVEKEQLKATPSCWLPTPRRSASSSSKPWPQACLPSAPFAEGPKTSSPPNAAISSGPATSRHSPTPCSGYMSATIHSTNNTSAGP